MVFANVDRLFLV